MMHDVFLFDTMYSTIHTASALPVHMPVSQTILNPLVTLKHREDNGCQGD